MTSWEPTKEKNNERSERFRSWSCALQLFDKANQFGGKCEACCQTTEKKKQRENNYVAKLFPQTWLFHHKPLNKTLTDVKRKKRRMGSGEGVMGCGVGGGLWKAQAFLPFPCGQKRLHCAYLFITWSLANPPARTCLPNNCTTGAN